MLQVACNDIGVLGCDFVAEGERARKVESRMLKHLREAHPQLTAGLSFEQHKELAARITSGIRVASADGMPGGSAHIDPRMAWAGSGGRWRLRRRRA